MRGANPRDYPLRPDRDAAREVALRAHRYVRDRATQAEVDSAIAIWREATGTVLNPEPLAILRRALESIRSIDCRCGMAGPCGCGEEAISIAEDALSDVYGCPRCYGLGDVDESSPDRPHARRACEKCGGAGLLAHPGHGPNEP